MVCVSSFSHGQLREDQNGSAGEDPKAGTRKTASKSPPWKLTSLDVLSCSRVAATERMKYLQQTEIVSNVGSSSEDSNGFSDGSSVDSTGSTTE